jgi:hypothetical protein
MARLSLLRITACAFVAAVSWLGCVDSSAPSDPPICLSYCDEEEAKCKGINYKDRDQCLAMCNLMKPGNEGTVDDTAGCRLTQAKAATQGDPVSCKKASAFGGGACGEPCDTWCKMVDAICITGAQGNEKPYGSEADCFEACKTKPIAYNANDGEGPQVKIVDSLNCRMFHVMLALGDRVTHCPHTEPVSAVCKNP